jgi:predicted glycosyltransferase
MQRIALYSQDTHGLGRMRRNIAIARALAADEPRAILLISGAGEAAILGLPEGADTLGLPAMDDGGHPGARCLDIGTEAMVRMRGAALRSALEAFRPDALIVDRLPAGLAGELRPSFDVLHRMGTRLVLGLPDVLGDHERVWADWHVSDAIDVVRGHYDRVWVYGDPHVFDPVVEHGLPRDVRRITRYTGYLDGSLADPAADARVRTIRAEHRLGDGPVAVCLAGGSEDGARLATTFADAPLPDGTTGVVLTGPFMAAERVGALEAAAARRDDLRVIRVLPGADTLIGTADRVVAMGGYHTTAEALAADRRALMVPSASGRPDQRIRAERLRELGAADLLPFAALTPQAVGAWVAEGPRTPSRRTGVIDTDGLARLPMLLDELRAPVEELAPRRRTGARRTPTRRLAAAPELAALAAS